MPINASHNKPHIYSRDGYWMYRNEFGAAFRFMSIRAIQRLHHQYDDLKVEAFKVEG